MKKQCDSPIKFVDSSLPSLIKRVESLFKDELVVCGFDIEPDWVQYCDRFELEVGTSQTSDIYAIMYKHDGTSQKIWAGYSEWFPFPSAMRKWSPIFRAADHVAALPHKRKDRK